MTRPFIPGWTTLHPEPPTPFDPTTWTYLYLDAAISDSIGLREADAHAKRVLRNGALLP
jgi:hypothetical protein